MLKLMLITNDPQLAHFAVEHGVDRIFVDLEVHGKFERQGHRDTLISRHSLQDIKCIREAIGNHELLVRINPVHDQTLDEVDAAIAGGADLLMVPMFRRAEEIRAVIDMVAGRASVIPLVETVAAVECFDKVVALDSIQEIYIGLNDLHLERQTAFMFEPMADGLVEDLARRATSAGVRFGVGGIARVGEGLLPGEMVLSEHMRLGSSAVILSRTFHRKEEAFSSEEELHAFSEAIEKLRIYEHQLEGREASQIQHDHAVLKERISEIAAQLRRG